MSLLRAGRPDIRKLGRTSTLDAIRLLGEATVLNDLTATSTPATNAVDPVTGELCLQNLLVRSDAFDQTAWSKLNVDITPDATAAPDGTLTADLATANASAGAGAGVRQQFTASATQVTYSIYAKRGSGDTDGNRFMVRNNTTATNLVGITINYATGAIAYEFGSTGATAVQAGNGWWRISITVSSGITASDLIRVYAGFRETAETPNESVYLWGAQVVNASVPGLYAPTTTAAALPRRRRPLLVGGRSVLADLVEGSRQNLLLQSQTFDNAAWTHNALLAPASNDAIAPDGTLTADRLIENTGSSALRYAFNAASITTVVSTVYTASVYAKAGARSFLRVKISGGISVDAWFNLTTGAVGTVEAGLTCSIQSVGNGWYRCVLTFAAGSTATYVGFGPAPSDGVETYTGDGSSGILVWGAQLEQAAFPSTYIPTTTAAVTRGADSLSVSLASLVDTRTNLLVRSQEFDNAAWISSGFNISVTANATIAPDGTTTADKVIATAVSQLHYIRQTLTKAASSLSYALSAYMKASEYGFGIASITDGANGATLRVNLTTGAVTSATTFGSGFTVTGSSSVSVGDGWYRCSLSVTSSTSTSLDARLNGRPDDGASQWLGDGTSGIFVWGAQLSQTPDAIEYIPTFAAAIPASTTGLRVDKGTILALAVPEGWTGDQDGTAFWHIARDLDMTSDFALRRGNATDIVVVRADAGGVQSTLAAHGMTNRALRILAGVWDSANVRAFINGAASGTPDTTLSAPYNAVTNLTVGYNPAALNNELYGYVALLYWPRALTADEIKTISQECALAGAALL